MTRDKTDTAWLTSTPRCLFWHRRALPRPAAEQALAADRFAREIVGVLAFSHAARSRRQLNRKTLAGL